MATKYIKESRVKNNEWQLSIMLEIVNKDNEKMANIWRDFMAKFEEHIKEHWKPYRSNDSYDVIAYITLNKNGQLLNKGIGKSSGIKVADDAILKSIDDCIPYPKLPQEYTGNIAKIKFSLNYNINMKNIDNFDKHKYNCQYWYCK